VVADGHNLYLIESELQPLEAHVQNGDGFTKTHLLRTI
jgi:hypothetical protein